MILKRMNKNNYSLYEDPNFKMTELKEEDFKFINVKKQVVQKAIEGFYFFKKRYETRTLFPKMKYKIEKIDLNQELLIHNYTGRCPIQTFEVNPVLGCNVGCIYCLVDDGIHQELVVYENYDELISLKLEQYYHENHFFYYSPKTEAFCEATLQTGIAHKILKAFIHHYEKHPDSKIRLFIASKAGVEALNYAYENETILDLFKKLRGRMQFNTSLSIFPSHIRDYLEPYASTIDNRLEACKLCQENQIIANSALVQPILITILTDELLHEFFKKLASYHIKNFKPEFLTASIENMTLISEIIKMENPNIRKELFELYYQEENLNHVKQRRRTAPNRKKSLYWIKRMKEIANEYGISMSICFWVRKELQLTTEYVPIINENGFKCLGYQMRLFEGEEKC